MAHFSLSLRCLLVTSLAFIPCGAAKAESFTYAPATCDMQITFPEKPYFQNKCTGTGATQVCNEVVNFTKVVDTVSSTNFRVTCFKEDTKELNKYTPEVLEETLKQMTKDANMTPYNIHSGVKDGFKKASGLSVGLRGDKAVIYSAQIWVGPASLFTMEAEMTGPHNAAIEKVFAEILKSTHPKDAPASAPKK